MMTKPRQRALAARAAPAPGQPPGEAQAWLAAHGEELEAALTERWSVFRRGDLLTLLRGPDFRLSAPLAAGVARRLLAAGGGLVHLADGDQPRFATRQTVAMETDLVTLGRELAARRPMLMPPAAITAAQARFRKHLLDARRDAFPERLEALGHLLGRGELQLLEGPPGAAKTRIVQNMVDAFGRTRRAEAGIMVTAPTDKAAAALAQRAGVAGQALDALLAGGTCPVGEGGLIVLDEAGMVGTSRMLALMAMAHKAGARLVMVGDVRQQAPAEAGHPFRLLVERLKPARLQLTARQRLALDRKATAWLREGKADKALAAYDRRGLIRFSADRALTFDKVAADYTSWARKPAKGERTAIILATDPAAARVLNARVRDRLAAAGLLEGGASLATAAGPLALAPGDRVLLGAAAPSGDGRTAPKGTLGTVLEVGQGHLLLASDDDKSGQPFHLAAGPGLDLAHAFAVDLATGQGLKAHRVMVALTGRLDLAGALVALSRHKKRATLRVDRSVYRGLGPMAEDFSRFTRRTTTLDLAP